ncbi:hypothetical protein ABH927_005910 [Planotetraspora sp. GP83]
MLHRGFLCLETPVSYVLNQNTATPTQKLQFKGLIAETAIRPLIV